MKTIAVTTVLAGVALCFGLNAQAAGLGEALRKQAGNVADASPLSALGGGSGTAGNAAGVISYCMKNNYLNADKAAAVKDQLLGKMGIAPKEEPKDEGYLSGLSGLITGTNGKSFSLDKVKGSVKEKACDMVLDNAKSLL